jgi:hypothetical protein
MHMNAMLYPPNMTFDQLNLNQFHFENGWNACMIH